MENNIIAREITKEFGGCFLDGKNILWKHLDGNWIGKRSVFTFDYKNTWLENTTGENVKKWLHGEDADYTEIFDYI